MLQSFESFTKTRASTKTLAWLWWLSAISSTSSDSYLWLLLGLLVLDFAAIFTVEMPWAVTGWRLVSNVSSTVGSATKTQNGNLLQIVSNACYGAQVIDWLTSLRCALFCVLRVLRRPHRASPYLKYVKTKYAYKSRVGNLWLNSLLIRILLGVPIQYFNYWCRCVCSMCSEAKSWRPDI